MTAFPSRSPLLPVARIDWQATATNGSPQIANAAPGRFGSLVDNFCIVDHPIGRDARNFATQIQAAPAPARHGESAPRNLVCVPFKPAIPGLSAPGRDAHRYHAPLCSCVMSITVTGIGTDTALPCLEPPWVLSRKAAMDEDFKQDTAGSTQRLLADRLRQRYARCRETLASYASEADAPPAAIKASLRLTVVQKDAVSPQRCPTGSGERFATLFSQAYSAARDSRNTAAAPMSRRGRPRVTA